MDEIADRLQPNKRGIPKDGSLPCKSMDLAALRRLSSPPQCVGEQTDGTDAEEDEGYSCHRVQR